VVTTGFGDQLDRGWASSGSMLCVGLDPDPERLPRSLANECDGVFRWCAAVVEATADLACAFKPQIAHFAAQRAEDQLERLCAQIREHHPDVTVLLDAKRGDVASTSRHYATEAFDRYGAHAVTVSPYLGTDAVAPFLAKGAVFALCHTSNQGAGELQDIDTGGVPLFVRVAEMVATRWSELGECGLVVGATYADELAAARLAAPELPILVPGLGAQAGDLDAALAAGRRGSDGRGLLLSASRSVFDAAWGDVRVGDPAPRLDAIATAARAAAQRLSQQIRCTSRVVADTNVETGAAAGETVDDSRG